ncbi:hypothetical protein ACFL7E_00210 [Thermodesulfobacteriota bacterium]
MTAPKNIPEEFKAAYQRLMGLLPDKLRSDRKIQNTTLVFLKFGGEVLARHSVEIYRIHFKEEMKRIKKRLREEALRKAAKSQDPGLQAPDRPDKTAQGVTGAETKTDKSS